MKARLILLRKLKLATSEKAKIARERKLQTNPARKNCNKTTFKRKQEKKSNYSASLKIKWKLLDTFIANFLGIYQQLVARPTPRDKGEHLVMGAGYVTER